MTTSTRAPATAAQASLYQHLRSHLGVLKLAACAEALPTVLDEAVAEKLTMTAALERLLAIEVNATEARRHCCIDGSHGVGEGFVVKRRRRRVPFFDLSVFVGFGSRLR